MVVDAVSWDRATRGQKDTFIPADLVAAKFYLGFEKYSNVQGIKWVGERVILKL